MIPKQENIQFTENNPRSLVARIHGSNRGYIDTLRLFYQLIQTNLFR